MNLSNRLLGFLIIIGFILFSYGFYKYFFDIKLTNLIIKSNIGSFSGTLHNSKFRRYFSCEEKKCLIKDIPPFVYDLKIYKPGYSNNNSIVDLSTIDSLSIYLEKKMNFESSDIDIHNGYEFNSIIYLPIYNNNKYYYHHNNDKLYIYNKSNNNIFNFDFVPKINYIKQVGNKQFVLSSAIGSYNINLTNNGFEYFSLFSDYVIHENSYIGIINDNDNIRKNNFGFNNINGNLVIFYDLNNKKFNILEKFSSRITKIYNINNSVYIETENEEAFLIN